MSFAQRGTVTASSKQQRLVKINVVGGAVVGGPDFGGRCALFLLMWAEAGLVLAPLAGMLADGFGLEAKRERQPLLSSLVQKKLSSSCPWRPSPSFSQPRHWWLRSRSASHPGQLKPCARPAPQNSSSDSLLVDPVTPFRLQRGHRQFCLQAAYQSTSGATCCCSLARCL